MRTLIITQDLSQVFTNWEGGSTIKVEARRLHVGEGRLLAMLRLADPLRCERIKHERYVKNATKASHARKRTQQTPTPAAEGISLRAGKVVSLLCGSQYEDLFEEERILYHVERDTPGLSQLLQASKEGYSFPVFRKRAPNDWEELGIYKATSVTEKTQSGEKRYIFTLIPVKNLSSS